MSRGPIPDYPYERPSVPDVVDLVRAYYRIPGNETGGNLHVVIDDGNIGTVTILGLFLEAKRRGDDLASEILWRMSKMTPTQRRNVAARNYYQ